MREPDPVKKKLRRILRIDLALRFVWQSTPGWTLVNLVLIVVQAPLPLASLYLMKRLVDEANAGVTTGDMESAFRQVALVIVLMAIVSLTSMIFGVFSGLVNQAQALSVSDYMQSIIHAQSVKVDLEYYENPDYYNTLRRAQQQALFRPLQILRGLTQLGQSSLSLVAIGGLLLLFHWVMIVVLIVTVIPGFVVKLWYSNRLYRWQRQRTETERRVWYYDFMLTGSQHAKEVRLFNLGSLFMERFRELRTQLRREQLNLSTRQAAAGFGAQLATSAAVYGSYAFIAYRTVQGDITLGDLVMYYQAFQRAQSFFQSILNSLAGLYEDNLFLTDLYDFLNLEPKVASPPDPKPSPRPMQTGIRFEQVSFSYPGNSRTVLHDVDLAIRPGEQIALVGENGSGKTTLIKLLCRLYDPTEGRITIDGIDLRELYVTDLRREMSVIMQDYVHYNLSAQENIWFGNVEVPPDPDRIMDVARHAGAHDVIAELDSGYDTILGRMFQQGQELSIGEWQKVALARAFLRDAQIIILDEPTSAVDAKAEYEIFQNLGRLTADRASVTISHRFSTVRAADCIYVLDDGRIIESGSHDDLVRLGGKYAFLFQTQAAHYQ